MPNAESYDPKLGIERRAEFSANQLYRYRLDRILPGQGKTAVFIGVNPSTASHVIDDPTVKKLFTIGLHHGITHWILVNKFALISSSPRALSLADDPIGPDCNSAIRRALGEADRVIVGWGASSKLPLRLRERWKDVVMMAADHRLECFGICQDGHPRHPLFMPGRSPIIRWKPPA